MILAAWACCLVGAPLTTAHAQEEGEDSDKVEEYVQELFLGESVYPQDAGEWQFSLGHFWNERGDDSASLEGFIEYGITDYFQVGVALPTNFDGGDADAEDGLGNVEFEVYWNVLNNPCTGWAAGVGFGYSLPEGTTGAGEDAHGYEPFVVVYRDFGCDAINFFGAVEIEDPREPGEETETTGDLAVSYIRPFANTPAVGLLELETEINETDTEVRLAPGIVFSPCCGGWEFGVSLPIGLDDDAPDFGVLTLLTLEI